MGDVKMMKINSTDMGYGMGPPPIANFQSNETRDSVFDPTSHTFMVRQSSEEYFGNSVLPVDRCSSRWVHITVILWEYVCECVRCG